jgi:hypothetical protein
MNIKAFEAEVQKIHPDLTILPNPKIDGLAGIYFQGTFLFGVPNHNIFNDENKQYGIDLPNGMFVRHRTRLEALAMVKKQVEMLKFDKDNADAILGRGKYSEAALADDSPKISENPENLIITE